MDIKVLYEKFMQCNGVTTDSRNCAEGSMFIALKGEKFNGNSYAQTALDSGCRYAVVDEAPYCTSGDERFLLVENCLQALQQLAREHRRALGTPIIGITGTNGKTTTKELIANVLQTKYNILYTQGNLNNHIGVPLTLLRLRKEHELAVVEMGASHPGDIQELVEIAEPDYGLITNVGKAHLEGFGSFEGVIRTKGELYDNLRKRNKQTIFLHADNVYLKQIAQGLQPVTYGSQKDCNIQALESESSPYLSFTWKTNDDDSTYKVDTQLVGDYNLPNALAAIAIGIYFGIEKEKVCEALAGYTPQNNRSQLEKTASNTLIIDAYNANPTSMQASIGNFYRMKAEHKLLILGDMRELGSESISEHQKIVEYLEQCGFEKVILVGSQFAATRHHYISYPDAASLIETLKGEKPVGQTILIKGSNGIKLSTVADYL